MTLNMSVKMQLSFVMSSDLEASFWFKNCKVIHWKNMQISVPWKQKSEQKFEIYPVGLLSVIYSVTTLVAHFWFWAMTSSVLLFMDSLVIRNLSCWTRRKKHDSERVWWHCSYCSQLPHRTGLTKRVENCSLCWTDQREHCYELLFLCKDNSDLWG